MRSSELPQEHRRCGRQRGDGQVEHGGRAPLDEDRLPGLHVGDALHSRNAPDPSVAHPQPVKDDAIEPVHDHEEEIRLPVGGLEVRHPVPEGQDADEDRQHPHAEGDQKAFPLRHHGVPLRDPPALGLLKVRLGVEIEAMDAAVPHRQLHQQQKQQAGLQRA